MTPRPVHARTYVARAPVAPVRRAGRPGRPAWRAGGDPSSERSGPGAPGWGLALFGGWVIQVALRLWLSAGQTMPVATPDETGYLFAARVLTGGASVDLSPGTVYRGGYSLLLLPALWASDDPATVYRICLVINALISASMLVLAYVLLRRLGLSRGLSYAVGHATALLPAVLFYSEFVLTDAVLPVAMTGWLLLAHSWLTAGPSVSAARVSLYGAGAGMAAAYVYVCHSRGTIMLLVHTGLLAVVALRRWRPVGGTSVAFAAMAAVAVAGYLLNHSLLPFLYPKGDNNLGRNVVERLTTVDGYGWTLAVGTGQLWSQVIVTGGLGGIGLVALTAVALRRGTEPRLRALALAVLAMVAGVAFVTAAALPVEYRVGNYAYARYLAFISPVLFAVGAAVVLRAPVSVVLRAAGATVVFTLLTAGVIQWYAGDVLSRYTYTGFDFPEVSFLTWDWSRFRLWWATLVALAVLGLLLLAGRVSRYAMVGLLAAVNLGAATTATMHIARPLAQKFTTATAMRDVPDLAEQRSIAVDWTVPWTVRVSQNFWAWQADATTIDVRRTPPPSDVDLVVLAWPKGSPATATWRNPPPGWQVVQARRTSVGDWVIWRRPSPVGPPASAP